MRRAALLAAALALVSSPLRAQGPGPPPGAPDPHDPTHTGWAVGHVRWFIATTTDLGYLYVRPRVSIGYGRPHALWTGVELSPVFAGSGVGAWGGLRASSPYVDFRFGARAFNAFERGYLTPQTSYRRLDLDLARGSASTITYDAELTGGAEAGPGEFVALASLSYVVGVPRGDYVFEESLRIIVKPPLVARARVGYGFYVLPSWGRITVGPTVDVLAVPGRAAVTVRAGLVARVELSQAVEVRGTFLPTIVSPDRLGLVGSDFTELGLRWRWSTGLE